MSLLGPLHLLADVNTINFIVHLGQLAGLGFGGTDLGWFRSFLIDRSQNWCSVLVDRRICLASPSSMT